MRNWKTTLVGIALIGGGIYTGVMGIASWTEVLAVVATGMGFILSKDYNVSETSKNIGGGNTGTVKSKIGGGNTGTIK